MNPNAPFIDTISMWCIFFQRRSSMKSFNIKSDMPDKLTAGKRLADIIRANKSEKVIKIVHGYGSTGTGGGIKDLVRKSLRNHMKKETIKAFIPGEALGTLAGFDEIISTYKHLISSDSDFRKCNDGITYVIL